MRRRFFVEKFGERREGGRAELGGEGAEHLGRVLRAEPGQLYELSDGAEVWLARVEGISGARTAHARIEFVLVEKIPARESPLRVRLLLSTVKFDRFEWCLEKAAELGAAEIVPLAASRSERALVQAAEKRARRWEKILLESAQQARRLRPPMLGKAMKPREAFASAREQIKVMLSERVDAPPIRGVLETAPAEMAKAASALRSVSSVRRQEVCLAIGPEGGWTEEEFAAAAQNGFREASLGGEILRTETAVIAALAIVRYALT